MMSKTHLEHPRSNDHQLLLQAWESVLAGVPTIYLSGPITTGPRFLAWYQREGRALRPDSAAYARALSENVIQPNNRDIQETATFLRRETHEPVLEPATLHIKEWEQADYLALWDRVIERFAGRLVVMPGWEFSAGCASEVLHAIECGLPIASVDGVQVTPSLATSMLRAATQEVGKLNVPISSLGTIADQIDRYVKRSGPPFAETHGHSEARKDVSLARLAEVFTVAQFISFSPDNILQNREPQQEFSRVLGFNANERFRSIREGISLLFERSSNHTINIRSFTPNNPQGRQFIYGIPTVDDAVAAVRRLGSEGLFLIANETIDIHDGGVSGVLMGDVIEFTPDDTPRGVEKPGVASLPRNWGIALLTTAYGFSPHLEVPKSARVEFSIHPKKCGWRHTNTLVWEYEKTSWFHAKPKLSWPNHFSRMLGDKTFGLLVAHTIGLRVPHTVVINRRIAPFSFGRSTGNTEIWIRTSPKEQLPGKFTSATGWRDPFDLLQTEDPNGEHISSVLCQSAVAAKFSGAAIIGGDGKLLIEGKAGEGESFMKGESRAEVLPDPVIKDITQLFEAASANLGPVRFEWAYDGETAWLLQLHRGATSSVGSVIFPGPATHWETFDPAAGLEALREIISSIEPGAGLILTDDIGLTSHIADVIRRAAIPAQIAREY
jgi:hypothetical protein